MARSRCAACSMAYRVENVDALANPEALAHFRRFSKGDP